jgi:hypothetical protein
MLGTDNIGDGLDGEREREDLFVEKNDVNFEEVFEKEEERPCGAIGIDFPGVGSVCDGVFDLVALLRTILQV